MRGPLDWGRWALKQGELYGLSDGEARVLQVLAAHVDRDGLVNVGFLTESEIGRRAAKNGRPRSPRTVRRLLARLRDRGLLSTTQRGRSVARHQLHDVLPVDQLSLDELSDRSKMAGRPTGQPANSLSTLTGQAVDRQEREEEVVVVDARETGRANTSTSDGLDGRYAAVAEILGDLPEPYRHFEPAAVESALRAYPDRDGVAAAHIVASRVHGGQTHTVHVNTLLMGVLARMKPTTEQPTAAAAPAAGQDGRWWDGALAAAVEGGPA